jgi:isopentenyldiphosphate isomerase
MSDLTVAQDPNELFDVVTFEGEPTGRTKPRAEVHRDGDWHRALHVWVVGVGDEGPFITFQRRSLAKDTWPGRLDATVGGHYRAGEGLEQTLRETEEEIGVNVSLDDLCFVGTRICINDGEPGISDHELQDVFFLRLDKPLTALTPNPAELAGLVRFPLLELLDMLDGDSDRASGRSMACGATELEWIDVTEDDFVIRFDRYFYRVACAAERFLAGARHFAV